MGYDKAKAAIEASLENSQVDYIDLWVLPINLCFSAWRLFSLQDT